MRPGVVLDPATGLPRVVPVRQADGVLTFAYETRRQGGMAVLVDVPPEAMSGARVDESEEANLIAELEKASRGIARSLTGAPEPEPGVDAAVVEELESRAERAEAAVEAAEETISEKDVEIAALTEQLAEAQRAGQAKGGAAKRRSPARAAA